MVDWSVIVGPFPVDSGTLRARVGDPLQVRRGNLENREWRPRSRPDLLVLEKISVHPGGQNGWMPNRGNTSNHESGAISNKLRSGPLYRLANQLRKQRFADAIDAAGDHQDCSVGPTGAE